MCLLKINIYAAFEIHANINVLNIPMHVCHQSLATINNKYLLLKKKK